MNDYIPPAFPGFSTLLWKFITRHTTGSIAEELSIPFWVGEHTCVLWQVPHTCRPSQHGGPGSSPLMAFLSRSVVLWRVCVERRNHLKAWAMPCGTETRALKQPNAGGPLFPAQAICHANYTERADSFLLQVQLSERISPLQHPPSTQTDIYPLTYRSACTWYY